MFIVESSDSFFGINETDISDKTTRLTPVETLNPRCFSEYTSKEVFSIKYLCRTYIFHYRERCRYLSRHLIGGIGPEEPTYVLPPSIKQGIEQLLILLLYGLRRSHDQGLHVQYACLSLPRLPYIFG